MTRPTPFFLTRAEAGSLAIRYDEILPGPETPESIRQTAVYRFYAEAIVARGLDGDLRRFRHRALGGLLTRRDHVALDDLFEGVKGHALQGGYMLPRRDPSMPGTFAAYGRTNSYAMLLAQILFVDNAVKEGLAALLDDGTQAQVLPRVARFLEGRSRENGRPIGADDARFFATLFVLQTAFDRLFITDEKPVEYDPATGRRTRMAGYDACTAYLEITNRRLVTATRAERRLCENLTTGWGDGIDRATWDYLNRCYYGSISPTTGKTVMFTENYDRLLEKMLPQFAWAKVRLSQEIIAAKRAGERLNVLEIGAGTGAFAIELWMSCKEAGIPPETITYRGVEPSDLMRSQLAKNVASRMGADSLPEGWGVVEGDLETFTEHPARYLTAGAHNLVVLCFCIHHCYPPSVDDFLTSEPVQDLASAIYVLDGVREHGWTKPYYMWADCESPECFDNVTKQGIWRSETLWTEPAKPIDGHAVTTAWCALRRLTVKL
ncbi:MAG: class I SAM-dependent methyltransferase [Acidobacteriota bacterium]